MSEFDLRLSWFKRTTVPTRHPPRPVAVRTCLTMADVTLGKDDRSNADRISLKRAGSGKSPTGRWCSRCTCEGHGNNARACAKGEHSR